MRNINLEPKDERIISAPVPHLKLTEEEAAVISKVIGRPVNLDDDRIPVMVDQETSAITAVFPRAQRDAVLNQLNVIANKHNFVPYSGINIVELEGDPELDTMFVAFDQNLTGFP